MGQRTFQCRHSNPALRTLLIYGFHLPSHLATVTDSASVKCRDDRGDETIGTLLSCLHHSLLLMLSQKPLLCLRAWVSETILSPVSLCIRRETTLHHLHSQIPVRSVGCCGGRTKNRQPLRERNMPPSPQAMQSSPGDTWWRCLCLCLSRAQWGWWWWASHS